MAVTTFVLFGASYLNLQFFPQLMDFFEGRWGTPSAVFLLFGTLCIGGVIFIAAVVPETKGKSLEQIAETLLKKNK